MGVMKCEILLLTLMYIFRHQIRERLRHCPGRTPAGIRNSANSVCVGPRGDVHSYPNPLTTNASASEYVRSDYTFSISEERNPVYGETDLANVNVKSPSKFTMHKNDTSSDHEGSKEGIHVYEEISEVIVKPGTSSQEEQSDSQSHVAAGFR